MRDYVAFNVRTGEATTIANVPTHGLYQILRNTAKYSPGEKALDNPGATLGDVRERVQIELLIRENGWR